DYRFSMDQVIPGLWLGGRNAAKNAQVLRSRRVSRVLTVDDLNLPDRLLEQFDDGAHRFVRLEDHARENLLDRLQECLQFIGEALEGGHNVLVHCRVGVSRSASVVIAYLMQSQQLAFQSAYDLVKAGRPVIGPNDGFVEQLRLFEQMGCQVDKDHAGYKELVERLKEETAILENSKLPAPSPRQGDLS
ncbi:hypothetical protein BOX15_Mlig010338g2, partial [Macrostomum lignano]